MYVTSKAGTEILKSQYEIIDSINGIPTLETDYSLLKHNHTEPMLMLSPAFNDKYIMVLKEQESVTESSRLRLTGVHSFIYDFSLDRIYEEYTQYFSLENILNLVFKGTEYAFEVSGSTRYNALAFENFGDNDKMSLINQICDRWELEYRVKDNKVYFADQRGSKTTKQFRYKMNIHDSHVNLDISEGATYIRAYFGKKDEENPSNSTYVEKEMLHPLAKDFGVRHAKPYSNEVITQEETMQRYMKMKIEETWKLSVEIDVLDLFGDGSAEVGDEVWAIDERMDLKYKTRIVEKRDYYDVNDRIYRTKVVLGNKTFIEAVSAQEVTAEDLEYEVRRYTNKRIEQLKAEKDNDFNAIRDTLRSEFSDALAQSKIEVAADFDRMEKLLDTKSDEWTEDFNQSVAESKEYAEQQAQAKADSVQTNLDSFKDSHQQLYDEVTGNILDIDTFFGDKSKTLKQQFDTIRTDFGTLQTDLSGVESDLSATKTDLQKQLDEARADLDGLEVGGRNLLPAFTSERWSGFIPNSKTVEMPNPYELIFKAGSNPVARIDLTLEPNTNYTMTFNSDHQRYYIYRKENGELTTIVRTITEGSDVFTFNTEDTTEFQLMFNSWSQRVDRDRHVWKPKLEKGTIATDWTPAPEDTEEKITTLNQQIEFIDGQLSAKLEQTDLLPINNKITEYGNSLTANAQSIESLISKTELHDGDITKWSNQTTANAESITSALSRISNTESGLTKAQTDIGINADGLSAVVNRVNKTETGIESLTTDFNIEAGKVETLITKTDGHDTQLSNIVADYNSIEQTVAANDDWLGTHGSNVLQTVDGFEQKVWLNDVANIGANLLPQSSNSWEDGSFWSSGTNNNGSNGIRTKSYIDVTPGESYTLQDHSEYVSAILEIQIVQWNGENRIGITDYVNRGSSRTFTARGNRVRIGLTPISGFGILPNFVDNLDGRIKMKLEQGRTATPIMNALSRIEQLANSVSIAVQELDLGTGYIKQTDLQLTPNYWQLGSMRIGAENVSSVLRGSPDAIDAVVSEFNLTGNLNAKGQITSLAVDAIEGNFARLFANQLTANVITSDHIQVGTALVDKMFATSARIDRLITKTHFVNEMHALTLNVVDLNASQIRTRLLSANTIEASWLKSGTALLDRVFSSTAMFERMMAKSAFVTTLSTVTLDLYELTIWRPDGVAYVQNGVPSFGIPVFFKPWMPADGAVTFDGRNYNTSMSGTQTFEMGYTQHAGRYLSIAFSANLRYSSASTSTYMGVVVRFINKPSGTSIRDVIKDDILVFRDNPSNEFQINVPLGSPTYGGLAVQLEFYRIGGTSNNTVQIRTGRAWING